MTQGYPSNPFGESNDLPPPSRYYDPYRSPNVFEPPKHGPALIEAVKWKVRPPAICLCVVAGLGMLMSLLSIVLAIALHDPMAAADPDNPLSGIQNMTGPDAAALHVIFIFVNLTILVGAIQMLRIKIRGMAFVASVLAIVNIGNFCCVLGIPAAIWCIIVLCQSDVAKAFEENY